MTKTKPAAEASAEQTPAPAQTTDIVVVFPPKGFPAKPGDIARAASDVAQAMLKDGSAVREASDRDRALYGRDPVDATGFAFPAPASASAAKKA